MSSRSPTESLASIDVFRDLSPELRAVLEGEFVKRPLRRGEVLVRQGEEADALFIVVSGRFDVRLAGRETPVAEIGPGSPIGEIAFLAGGTRTATVTAVRDSIVLRIGRVEFERLCEQAPQIWRTLTATLAGRLADQTAGRNPSLIDTARTIAVIPAGPGAIPPRFLELLHQAFASVGRTILLDSGNLASIVGGSVRDLASGQATEAFNALESAHDFVFFVADQELTEWSEKAIRQADLVLRIGTSLPSVSGDIPENAHERLAARLLKASAHRLVLVHPQRLAPEGTRHWLGARAIAMHHHVAMTDRADVDRLCRFVTGRALGLVACGGGAFCAAHTGLYKALVGSGIAFDIMGGTSGGSAMAAAFAMGQPPDEIVRSTHDIFVANRALRRFTWPRYSLLDHTHFDRLLARHYQGIDIEDLWIPYFAVSTNLSRYALHKHVAGDLWSAIRASGSIPALLPPFYTEDGQMLVDGCLLDNVPIRLMHELKRGPNIVIAFEVPQLERFRVDYRSLPSRGAMVRRLMQPFGRVPLPAAPGLGAVLFRSLMANRQGYEQHLESEDLVLVPPLPSDMGILDWHRHAELMAAACIWGEAEIERHLEIGHPALDRRVPQAELALPRVTPKSSHREKS